MRTSGTGKGPSRRRPPHGLRPLLVGGSLALGVALLAIAAVRVTSGGGSPAPPEEWISQQPELIRELVGRGRAREVERLLAQGADPNSRDSQGYTAAMHAASRGQSDVLHLLLGSGADPNARAADATTALHVASGAGRASSVDQLIAAGADMNTQDAVGNTPLMMAILAGSPAGVSSLLRYQADAYRSTIFGFTPMAVAVLNNDVAAVRLLLSAGVDPDYSPPGGPSAREVAERRQAREIIEVLTSGPP